MQTIRHKLNEFLAVLAVLGSVALCAAPARAAGAGKDEISWQPAKLVRGSPVLFQLKARRPGAISGEWMGHRFDFSCYENGTRCTALVGIPVETKPGSYPLHVVERVSGKDLSITKQIKVADAHYPKIAAHVAKKFTEPNADQLKEISADKSVKERVLATESADRLWGGPFEAPVPSQVSDAFGTERTFNGAVQSRHLGLDFAAPAGTPVHAVNGGTVILARDLYFEGGFIVIDHGQGLLSLYLHLSDFTVKTGDAVSTGQVIGKSGSSGRATGPHLHLAVRWQGVYVDPGALLKMNIP